MKHYIKPTFVLAGALLAASSFLNAGASAPTPVATVPVGYSTWEIAAGTGSARSLTSLALPLYQPTSSIDGAATGVITGVTSSTITVSGAGWTPGDLSAAAAPFCLRITKDGSAAEGRTLLVSTTAANTADTLTIDLSSSGVSDLTTLGIAANTDTFELIECDTLSSLFGEPAVGGVIGGEFAAADVVWLYLDGAWAKFYYNTTLDRWTRFTLGNPDASNQPVLPDSGILYSRLADESSSLVVTGTVPSTDREVTIRQAGFSVIGSSWPVDMRLDATGIELIPEWTASADVNVADVVWIYSTGSWSKFYYDGANWRRKTLGTPVSDDFTVSGGSAVLIQRLSPASSDFAFNQTLPYTL